MSSYIWGKPDRHQSIEYPNHHQPVGYVEHNSFVPTQWQYDSEGKSTHKDFTSELEDHEQGELEITFSFKGRSGSAGSRRTLKLTSNVGHGPVKSESVGCGEGYSTSGHSVFSPLGQQQLCIVDENSQCMCRQFSPSLFQGLLAHTLNPVGLSTTSVVPDSHFDRKEYGSCAGSEQATENTSRTTAASVSSKKKRLMSNASDDDLPSKPNKKTAKLSQADAEAEEEDGSDNGERHTCPYFKMYPELHLECGTKDLAQRPKIKSHVVKDHLKKNKIPTPPEIKSQKCDPWDRWCKWIVQGTDKADRPVPNSTPDFFPILSYIVSAGSKIPSDGLTCFSSVMLRLFKNIRERPEEWAPFVQGLEAIEQSINGPQALGSPPKRSVEPKREDDDEGLAEEDEDDTAPVPPCSIDARQQYRLQPSQIPRRHDLRRPHYPEPLVQHAQYAPPPHGTEDISASYASMTHSISSSSLGGDILPSEAHIHPHHHHAIYQPQSEFDLSHWLVDYPNMMPEPQLSHDRQVIDPSYTYQGLQGPCDKSDRSGYSPNPAAVGANGKSNVRTSHSPKMRKRKPTSRTNSGVDTPPSHEGSVPPQTHGIAVKTPSGQENYEFMGKFNVASFQSWLYNKFNFTFNCRDGRRLWCVDIKEDIQVNNADGIRAHLKNWSTQGNYNTLPTFKIDTVSTRTLNGNDRWAMFTPEFVDDITQEGFSDNISSICLMRPGTAVNTHAYHHA